MLALIFWITVSAANLPSQWLSQLFAQAELWLQRGMEAIKAPPWLSGLLLQGVFARCGEQKKVLGQMGYHLGRWIYLMDAYADREKDQKKGSYNPFLRRFPQQGEDMHETAAFVLNSTLAGLKNAYDLLDVKKHKGILDKILQRGLYKKTEELLKIGRGKTENGSV